MSCFPCFGSKNSEEEVPAEVPVAQVVDTNATPPATPHAVSDPPNLSADVGREPNATGDSNSRTFTFRELLMATKNFKQESLIGEGGFGKLHKGKLQSGEVVAVKHLDRGGTQGSKEFLVEVLILTLLNHQNLVKLIGYCADGDQRLLVYEYMSFGSLDVHLHDISDDKKPLDWQTRMKIASGVAQGLEYLHEKANPPVFYRDLKPANILLDEDYNPRLSGYGIAKLVNGDTKMHASPRVMGTYGYCAPEYERQGELTAKSDVYSFGVILLELITGRRALDTTRPTDEQNLVSWAQPFFRDQKRFPEMADPLLQGRIPQKCLNQAIGMAAMCLQEEPSVRPLMGDVLSMLSFLEVAPPEEAMPASLQAAPSKSEINGNESEDDKGSSSSDDESDDGSVSSDNDEDHPEDQNECTEKPSPNQSRKFEKQDTSSQHKYKTKAKSEQKGSKKSLYSIGRKSLHDNDSCDGGSSHHSLKNYDDNEFLEGNVHESSLSNSKTEWSDGIAPQNSMNNATPQGHVSMNLRKNSVEGSEGGSIGSSIGHGGYDGSFVWSIGSSTDYQLQDGSARRNSGCISNADIRNDIHGLSMRQQSIPNS